EDRLIFENTEPGFFMSVDDSPLNDWITISLHDHETSESYLLPANDPSATPRLVAARQEGVIYDLEPAGEEFFILTNIDDCKDFKIMSAPRSEEHTSELQSRENLVCRLLLEKKKKRRKLKQRHFKTHVR